MWLIKVGRRQWLIGLSTILMWWQISVHFFSPTLKYVFCDVGQGDAGFWQLGSIQLLIDAGPDESVIDCLNHYLPRGDRVIELVVATHPDKDHIGGFPAVFRHYSVTELILPGVISDSDFFTEFHQAVLAEIAEGMRLTAVEDLERRNLSADWQLQFLTVPDVAELREIYQPLTKTSLQDIWERQAESQWTINDHSIVLFITFFRFSAWMMGDAGIDRELSLISTSMLTPTTVLKVGHHGAKSSSSEQFLQKLQPEVALIGVGVGNRYGHPSSSVINDLKMLGVKILRTDINGTIRLQTNGFEWW